MKKRLISLLLTLAMAASLATSALAYSSPDFSDVPAENWAYKYVMEMADAGVIKGTGAGMFSPDKKVSAEMLLTLVGRIAFPEVKVGKEDTWYGPYVKAAQSAGWLEGTKIDPTDTAAEVTRYDMAVVLAFAAKKLGIAEKTVDTGKIKDFGEIPNKYTAAVTQVYGNGLIKGDGNGNFSGTSTMRRDEAAAVMSRLIALKPGGSTGTTPEKPTESPEGPSDAPMVTYTLNGELLWAQHVIGRPIATKKTDLIDTPFKIYYTEDGGATSTLVYEGKTGNKPWGHGAPYGDEEGRFVCSVDLPEDAFSGSDQDQKGLYISAETELDGQKLVTSDLRTDGRAHKTLFSLKAGTNYYIAELTSPEGEKAHFTFQGHVLTQFATEKWGGPMPGFTVQLHLPDGRIVGEAVSQEDGSFSMECVVDVLDGGFDNTAKDNYYVTVSGSYKGSQYAFSGISNTGELMLTSLWQLGMYDEYGKERPNQDYIIGVSEKLLQNP